MKTTTDVRAVVLRVFVLTGILVTGAGTAQERTHPDTPAAQSEAPADGDVVELGGAVIGRMGEPAAVDPEEFEFSEAETRLWLSDHLKNITQPTRLHYEFQKTGSYEAGFVDSVYLDIVAINPDGTKNTEMQFFTGPRAQPFGAGNVTDVTGNPVLGTYLGGDIDEMNRLTGGSSSSPSRWRYFQRRIKLALAEAANVEQISVDFNGRSVAALRITIAPYVKDPHRAEFEQFADKRYEFVLSDDVPGTLYQIRTLVPGGNGAEAPLIEEILTLRQVEKRG